MNTLRDALRGGTSYLGRTVCRDQGGYTMVELIFMLGILGVLGVLLVSNTRTGDQRKQLRDAAETYVTAVRHAESLAAAGAAVAPPGNPSAKASRPAYGVCFTAQPDNASQPCASSPSTTYTAFQVYARAPGNSCSGAVTDCPPDAATTIVNTYRLSTDTYLCKQYTYIDYVPPTLAMVAHSNGAVQPSFTIKVQKADGACENNVNYERSIKVRSTSGAVYVE